MSLPAKPGNPSPTDLKEPFSRRLFIRFNLCGVAGLFVGTFVQTIRYLIPNVLFEPPRVFSVGTPDRYTEGSVTFLAKHKVFMVHDDRGFHAISSTCTHLGCTVNSAEGGFDCPCHGSKFDPKGQVKKGPAPKPLQWFETRLAENGELVVDTTKTVGQDFSLKLT
ncbi:MAG: ubiquinol-cytochrome c reductase iron-sulfur subunit [Armatimonadetes bacterium]|nr:ubiquinol-cytochrome c reductase iron-sulfur subunit [Armatimonadota bacterium]PIU61195.1 MAG: hypothetical protein COS85_21600 [Armatimonadetes bacterium CG07_land_8_20_14_0_80_59_28]PIY44632.1 MAG: hypothetical protein COZ05_07680 [Armatimonadetes bacterium CG_4_10_14_3_um_filter_59_10]PJB63919.1 MAG: hypothetical protein CO095_15515 [Armatimonadetes bacterium CG_4_9_14_3_um_filter_58_7]